jgi:hypothetical protein
LDSDHSTEANGEAVQRPGPTPSASSILVFKAALNGERGDLDAWLELKSEDEVRAHINALLLQAHTD